jgi:S1-C subfamily serine protease
MLNRYLLITLLLQIILFSSAYSQKKKIPKRKAAERFLNNVVSIRTEFNKNKSEENGFGIIVGEDEEEYYIVTARHVVSSSNPDVTVNNINVYFQNKDFKRLV